eukprot:TRINITY_DN3280_c1_g1_i5.p1 TRINITY_DN3280_c1_g1~~TRINITY_DN3280_c1_g1_i5.p1  ORF type:complete len:356 (+),score=153.89 TRINITY_DN3280_c1_g1_i5:719-1786(+)
MLFDRFDSNRDGSISVQDMCDFMAGIGLEGVNDGQITDMFVEADKNQNGSIEFDEFEHLVRQIFSDSIMTYSDILKMDIAKLDGMAELKNRLAEARATAMANPGKKIERVCLIVVVKEEIQPVLDKFNVAPDPALTADLLSLATAYRGSIDGVYDLTVLQVATSEVYGRHYSGYTQSSAVAAMAAKVIQPDLVISFGTAGGWPSKVQVGDCVVGSGCVFLDRSRTSSKNSFDWGVFGGPTMPCGQMVKDLGLREGLLGVQINYTVTKVHTHLIDCLGLYAIDMESASEAQILMQTKTNFMALKVVSNGVFPGDGARMEADYVKHKEMVSKKAAVVLSDVLEYLKNKTVGQLAEAA